MVQTPPPGSSDGSPTGGSDGLAGAVLELYELAPEQFTARRDELAAQARTGGDRALAATVRRLRRPTTSAWALNLLSRREPDLVGQLLQLGEALRAAQSGLDGAALRELDEQRRQVVTALAGRAGSLAQERGHPLDAELSRQVEQSLTAALADPDVGAAVVSGQLTKPVSVVGFGVALEADAVAVPSLVLVPSPAPPDASAASGEPGARARVGTGRAARGVPPAGPGTGRLRVLTDERPGSGKRTAPVERTAPAKRPESGRRTDPQEAVRQRCAREQQERVQQARAELGRARAAEEAAEREAAAVAAAVGRLRERRDARLVERDELAERLAACEADLAQLTSQLREQERAQDGADEALRAARRATRQAERQAERT